MGHVHRIVKTELFCNKGHFLTKNEKGEFAITNNKNETTRYDASNGFDVYLDDISLFSTIKEEQIKGTDRVRKVETRIWTFDMHDEDGYYYEMKFFVGANKSSSTFFGFVNSLLSIEQFGLLKLTSAETEFAPNGKDVIHFTHINVVNYVNDRPVQIYHKFKKDEIPEFKICLDAQHEPIVNENGYTKKDYSAKLKFFENLIPGIVEKIHNSKYPAAQLSSGKVAPALTEYVEDYSEAGDDMDQEQPEIPVKAKRIQRDMPGMDDEPPKGYDARTAKAAQKDSLYPHVNDDGEVDDVPF